MSHVSFGSQNNRLPVGLLTIYNNYTFFKESNFSRKDSTSGQLFCLNTVSQCIINLTFFHSIMKHHQTARTQGFGYFLYLFQVITKVIVFNQYGGTPFAYTIKAQRLSGTE